MREIGYCYFIEAVGLSRFKIGHAKILPNRFDQLDTASPCDLIIFGVIKGKDYIKTEVEFHNVLKDRRIRRDNGKGNWKEWFKLTRAEVEKLVHTSDGFTVADGDFAVEAPSNSDLSTINITVVKETTKTVEKVVQKPVDQRTLVLMFAASLVSAFLLFNLVNIAGCGKLSTDTQSLPANKEQTGATDQLYKWDLQNWQRAARYDSTAFEYEVLMDSVDAGLLKMSPKRLFICRRAIVSYERMAASCRDYDDIDTSVVVSVRYDRLLQDSAWCKQELKAFQELKIADFAAFNKINSDENNRVKLLNTRLSRLSEEIEQIDKEHSELWLKSRWHR